MKKLIALPITLLRTASWFFSFSDLRINSGLKTARKKARALLHSWSGIIFLPINYLAAICQPSVHCPSCILGVARPRSVKFASVRTRWKGGGACELSSAELPLIRRFAFLADTSQVVRDSTCDIRVCVSSFVMGSYTFSDPVWATHRCVCPASSRAWRVGRFDRSRSRKHRRNFSERSSIASAFP